jgi:hypothetical protein
VTDTQLSLLDEGARLRDEGMARVTENSDEECIRRIDEAIAYWNRLGMEWSANDLREQFDDWEALDSRPQLIGARVRAAAMRKEMRRVGYTPSTLPSTHSHVIAVWVGAL